MKVHYVIRQQLTNGKKDGWVVEQFKDGVQTRYTWTDGKIKDAEEEARLMAQSLGQADVALDIRRGSVVRVKV